MTVDIAELKYLFTCLHSEGPPCDIHARLHEALNELEELRRYRNDTRQLREEHTQLRNDFARLTEIKDGQVKELREMRSHIRNLIFAGNAMRDELTGRTETTSFKKWFKNLHPETIESITFNLRKKEN